MSSSSVELQQQCPMKYFARFVHGVGAESEERDWAPYLGVQFHKMMRDWARSGDLGHLTSDVEDVKKQAEMDTLEKRAAWWINEAEKPWLQKIVAVEEAGAIQLATLLKNGKRHRLVLKVKPDVVIESDGKLWTLDWKTVASGHNHEVWLKKQESSIATHSYALYARLRWPEQRYGGAIFVSFEKKAKHFQQAGQKCICCEPAKAGYGTVHPAETIRVDHVDLTDMGVRRSVELVLEAAKRHRKMLEWSRENITWMVDEPFTPPASIAPQHSWNCGGKFDSKLCYLRGTCDGQVTLDNRLYYSRIDPFSYYEEEE